jgi:hypothetical protein
VSPSNTEPQVVPAARPFKPHPRLLAVAWIVVVLWAAFLLTLYFTTVRHAH